jgi:hypothetical protein
MGYAMPAQLPPLPSSGGTYELSPDGQAWDCKQSTAPAGTEPAAEPALAPEPETPDYDSAACIPDADRAEVGDELRDQR